MVTKILYYYFLSTQVMLGIKRSRSMADISMKDDSPRKFMKTDEKLTDTCDKEKLKEKVNYLKYIILL